MVTAKMVPCLNRPSEVADECAYDLAWNKVHEQVTHVPTITYKHNPS